MSGRAHAVSAADVEASAPASFGPEGSTTGSSVQSAASTCRPTLRLGRPAHREEVAELHAGGAHACGVVGEGGNHGAGELPRLGARVERTHHGRHRRRERGHPPAGVVVDHGHPARHPRALVHGERGCHEAGAGQLVSQAGGRREPGERGAERAPRHPRAARERLGGARHRHEHRGQVGHAPAARQLQAHHLRRERLVGPEDRRSERAQRLVVQHAAAVAHDHQPVSPCRVQHRANLPTRCAARRPQRADPR